MKTSVGFHTFTVFKRLHEKKIAKKLFSHFKKYKDSSEEVEMMNPKGKPGEWLIYYTDTARRGITWILRYNVHSRDYKEYIVEARINPKILAGIKDYITASTSDYLPIVEERFNEEATEISEILGKFSSYTPKRVDFCINFDLKELGIRCTPEQMMKLIKMGDYPSYFKEWLYYDKISHRKKAGKFSFYLISRANNINCYYKYKQLEEEYPNCPHIDRALHVIRFEVQCKYSKIYVMRKAIQKKVPEYLITPQFILNELLSDFTSQNMIEKYFMQIIKPGDYYTLKKAIEIIEDQHFSTQKEQVLIDTLKEINRQGIARTRASIAPEAIPQFYRTLDTLAKLKINPVTIPKSFGVKHIPNLLDTCNKLRDSGSATCSLADPFEPLEEPFEDFENLAGSYDYDDIYEGSDTDHDTEPEYEETFLFEWELPRK